MSNVLNPSEKLALVVTTFDAEYLLQIAIADSSEPIVTVGEPAGPCGPLVFCVWEGSGINEETGGETQAAYTVDIKDPKDPRQVSLAWAQAVKFGYDMAVSKLFEGVLTAPPVRRPTMSASNATRH